MSGHGDFDSSIYGEVDKQQYLSSLPGDYEDEDDDVSAANHPSSKKNVILQPLRPFDDNAQEYDNVDSTGVYREQYGSGLVNTRISDRETEVDYFSNR